MNEDTWNRVKRIFHEAVGRPAAERDAFLADACADDAVVRSEVEELLAPRDAIARQIDFIFASESLTASEVRVVLDRDREGIYPSDHYGLAAVLRIARPR